MRNNSIRVMFSEPLRRMYFSLCVVSVMVLGVGICGAEIPQAPPGTGPLPDLRKGGSAGVAVSQPYVSRYATVLPPEVAALVGDASLAFEAALSGSIAVEIPKAKRSVDKPQELSSTGSLPAEYDPRHGFPFSAPSQELLTRDPASGGAQVLWNVTANLWKLGLFDVEGRVRIYQDPRGAPRELGLLQSRLYPRSFGSVPGKLTSLFRERIELTHPPVLTGIRLLTLRFLSPEEDYVWASSPTTESVRQMTGSNRSDPIFPRGISPDDFFVWSGKNEGVQIRGVQRIATLVPIIHGSFQVEKGEDGCALYSAGKGAGFELRNEARRIPQAPAWAPSNALWVLRDTWRIELENRDPFSLDSRLIVYVDADTYTPVYKMVFDTAGKLLKMVVGILGVSDSAADVMPHWRGEALISPTDGVVTTVEVLKMRVCGAVVKGRTLKDFDPSALIAAKKKVESTPVPSKVSPPPTKVDEIEPEPED